jgi:hypothetical protein
LSVGRNDHGQHCGWYERNNIEISLHVPTPFRFEPGLLPYA